MFISNWLKAGRRSKKEIKVIPNYHFHPAGELGESKWNDYVQITFFDTDEHKFKRLDMTPEEAKKMMLALKEGLKKFF